MFAFRPPRRRRSLRLAAALVPPLCLTFATPCAHAASRLIGAEVPAGAVAGTASTVFVSGEIGAEDAAMNPALEVDLLPPALSCGLKAQDSRAVAQATSLSVAPPAGAFAGVAVPVRPILAGPVQVCVHLWVGDEPTTLATLAVAWSVAPPVSAAPAPACRLDVAPRGRRSGRVRVECDGVQGAVELRAWRPGPGRSVEIALRSGHGSVSARRLGLAHKRRTTVTVLVDGLALDTRALRIGR